MSPLLLPSDLKRAINRLEGEFSRAWTVGELAAASGVGRRALQKHFQRFVGKSPMEFLRDLRLAEARRQLLGAAPQADVAEIAGACGLGHLGRFASRYRERYGESPSATLRRRRLAMAAERMSPLPSMERFERPGLAVLPFGLIGAGAEQAAGLSDEIAAALCRIHWIAVVPEARARYHLRGKVRTDLEGRLRVTLLLRDAATGRHLWADSVDGAVADIFAFENRVAERVARALQPLLRDAEIDRARLKDPAQLGASELTMKALPSVLSIEPAGMGAALEWLERAMELAPDDPLPVSVAAWCRALRAAHHFAADPDREREAARALATRGSQLNNGESEAAAALVTAYTLIHDLDAAAAHAERALAISGGSSWIWGRSGFLHAYRGDSAMAIERLQIASALAPVDPLNYLWSAGTAIAHLEEARYDEAIHWFRRGRAEQPRTINYLLAPACALKGARDEARHSFVELRRGFPDLTIAQVRAGIPLTQRLLDRMCDVLESLGMRLS